MARILKQSDWPDANGSGTSGPRSSSASHPSSERYIFEGVEGVELADSITGDAHKLFNVPYDCGFYFSKHLDVAKSAFRNEGAVYLTSGDSSNSIPSPLHIGIENSRRFRTLPLYASLHAYGQSGYVDMLRRQITVARSIALYIAGHPWYELLPIELQEMAEEGRMGAVLNKIYIIVLFRGKQVDFNATLVNEINKTGRIFVAGTEWGGKPATRIAVANWQVEPGTTDEEVQNVLNEVWTKYRTGLLAPNHD
jgi:glutamate/tyrosine decarboxylase-like PLP-dependent enzyme